MTLEFHAENNLLEGFGRDSGFLPAASPAAIRVVAGANAELNAAAMATASGDTLTPVAGSGSLSMEAGFSLEVSAKIDAAGVEYEGVVETFEYGIDPASTVFDPFAIGETVTLESTLPPGELARVPVPSVPGTTLVLDIVGGQVNTAYSGTCAVAAGGAAQYTGEAVIDGTLLLEGTIEIDVLITTETFGPFAFEVPIPESTTELDLGTFSTSDGTPSAASPCNSIGGDTDSPGPTGTGGEGSNGAVTSGDRTGGESSGGETDQASTGCEIPGGCEECTEDCMLGRCVEGQCVPTGTELCTPVFLAIPDSGAAVTSTVVVPEGGVVTDVAIGIALTHPLITDLTIDVEHEGTTVRVYDQECAKGNTNLVFNDAAAPLDCTAPTSGVARIPSEPLTGFDGVEAGGAWTFSFEDHLEADEGTVTELCLSLEF